MMTEQIQVLVTMDVWPNDETDLVTEIEWGLEGAGIDSDVKVELVGDTRDHYTKCVCDQIVEPNLIGVAHNNNPEWTAPSTPWSVQCAHGYGTDEGI